MAEQSNPKYNELEAWLQKSGLQNYSEVAVASTQAASDAVRQGMSYAGGDGGHTKPPEHSITSGKQEQVSVAK